MRKQAASSSLIAVLLLLASAPSVGQEHEPDPESGATKHEITKHEFHRNHFGGLIGVSTHHDTDDSALTLGLEYARQFSPRWAVGAYIELVSSDIERDTIVAIGGIFYPIRGLGLILGPGVESADKEVLHDGEVEREEEYEFLLRLGVGYSFPLTPEAVLGPVLLVDRAGNRWTTVVAIGMTVGF